jgi:hypothetical protein
MVLQNWRFRALNRGIRARRESFSASLFPPASGTQRAASVIELRKAPLGVAKLS